MKKVSITFVAFLFTHMAFAQTENTFVMSAPSEEAKKIEKAYEEYATPGEMHKIMAKDEGNWREEITMWMSPGAEPVKSIAKVSTKMLLDGRYQQSKHHGSFENMPFEGISTLAYDNAKKIFVSTWIDNMGTGIMIMESKPDAKGKTIHMYGKQVDPVTGKDMDVREEITIKDDGSQVMKMFLTPIDGKEYQNMEIVLTRVQK